MIFNLLYSSFEYGIGTQVMLSSTVFSPVREQLLKSAQNWLNEDEIEALKRRFQQVILILYISIIMNYINMFYSV